MMSEKSPKERHAMMERRIKSMTPEMRQKRLAMMEKHMQMMQTEMQMMRDHIKDPTAGGSAVHDHEHGQQ